jgi:DNA invertase Pin-like site-specific DNA recombinase
MLAGVIASLATFETEVRSERTAASLEAKKLRVAEGRETWNVGRPVGAVHKLTPEVREKLYQMADEGTKKSEIAEVLKLSRQSVYRALKLRPD